MEERKNKSLTNKQLLGIEVLIICSATIILIGAVFIYEYLEIDIYPKKLLILFSVILLFSLYLIISGFVSSDNGSGNNSNEILYNFAKIINIFVKE